MPYQGAFATKRERTIFWIVAIPVALVVGYVMHVDLAADDARRAEASTRRSVFMRDCIVTLPEKRCKELWKWRRTDALPQTVNRP